MSNISKNKWVAVKCEGDFTEWYSPNYEEPYEDNAEFREYYDEVILPRKPVMGPSLGDAEIDYISGDLECHAERMCSELDDDWMMASKEYADAILMCLADGKPRVFSREGMQDVKITPYTKEELPPINEESLEIYGKYKELIRATVMAI